MKADQEFRDWFERLKQDDARSAPSFESTRRAAIVKPRVHWNLRFAIAALMLVASAAGVLTYRSRRPAPSIVQLSAWHSPTDFLLDAPGIELLRTTPRFGASFIQSEGQK